jgi:diaminohydroxyphosphoribosylaminopyrimidine deaminase/5-amino-6-(5-phosphoribosylamino)uracil reductase
MAPLRDDAWMERAIEAGRRATGRTAPRPAVGAAIVRGDQLLAVGHTDGRGGAHAEPSAIRNARAAGHDVRGATLYVTLEPCCHHGRTPPCTSAILEAGIARVVVGCIDPYPPMRGHGLEVLRRGGVEVDVGVRREDCARSLRGFLRAVTVGLPEVTLKVAASLDGRLATASGESKWITGERTRFRVQRLRSEHDAILVGIGTVLADDPRLTARLDGAEDPVPVVLDSQLRLPETAALLRHPKQAVVICAEDAPERDLPARIVRVPRGPDGRVDLEKAMRAVVACGCHRVLVEGGSTVHRAFLEARLADTLEVHVAPVLIPGGKPWLGGAALERLGDAVRFGAPEVDRVGEDVVLRYSVGHAWGVP